MNSLDSCRGPAVEVEITGARRLLRLVLAIGALAPIDACSARMLAKNASRWAGAMCLSTSRQEVAQKSGSSWTVTVP